MKKIAFFVEGQTEQVFINKLLREIIGHDNLTILEKKVSGGTNAPKRELIKSYSIQPKSKYTVLIYDCGSDNRVKSEILDNITTLKEAGYSCVIGLRDLYPLSIEELPLLEKGLKYQPYSAQKSTSTFDIIIAVREVETWFLGETSHFLKVDKKLTGQFIEKHLGFNPDLINPLLRQHPSEDINKIYKLVGKTYSKKYWQVEKLVNRLNFDKLIKGHLRSQIPSLDQLVTTIERFEKGEVLTTALVDSKKESE